jgi:hypothetical protein
VIATVAIRQHILLTASAGISKITQKFLQQLMLLLNDKIVSSRQRLDSLNMD